MKTRLDITGLSHFWQKILNQLQDKKTIQTAVTDPTASGVAVAFIDSISQNTQGVIVPTKKTVPNASQSSAGLMSAEDKLKLDAVETGAQVNTVTGVKGSAEASYRQGDVELTPENLGITISQWAVNGESILVNDGIYARSYNESGPILPSEGVPTGFSKYGSALSIGKIFYKTAVYIDVFGRLATWSTNQNKWIRYFDEGHVYGIQNGGTGATDAAGARANLGAVAKTGDTMTGPLTIQDNLQSKIQFSDSNGITGFVQGYQSDHRITFVEYTPNGNGHFENYSLPVPTANTEDKAYNILTDKNILTSNTISTSYGTVTYYKSLHTCTVVLSLSGMTASGWQSVCYGLPAAAASMYFVVYGGSGPCSVYITTAGQLMFNGQGTQSATAYSFTYVTRA